MICPTKLGFDVRDQNVRNGLSDTLSSITVESKQKASFALRDMDPESILPQELKPKQKIGQILEGQGSEELLEYIRGVQTLLTTTSLDLGHFDISDLFNISRDVAENISNVLAAGKVYSLFHNVFHNVFQFLGYLCTKSSDTSIT